MILNKWQIYFWLILLMLITATVGTRGLYASELYIDEAISAIHIHYGDWNNPLQVAQSLQRNSPDHVPGYFVILMLWGRLTAFDPGILRYFSVLLGVLALAMTYRLGTSLHSPMVGLMATTLVGLSGLFLYYTHEMRMYTLQMTLIAFETWLYWEIINNKTSIKYRHWVGLTVGAILLIYTHYFSIFPLVGLGVYHFLFVKKDRRWVGVAISFAIAGATLLPWLWVQRDDLTSHYVLDGAISSGEVVTYTAFLFSNGFPILLLLIGVGIVIGIRKRDPRFVFALTITLGAFISFVLTHEFVGSLLAFRRARYVLVLWNYLAILSAISLLWLMRWRWMLPVFVAVWVATASIFLTSPDLPLQTNRVDDLDVNWYPPIYKIARQLQGLATNNTPIWLVDLHNPDTDFKIPDRVWLMYSDWSGFPIRYLRDTAFDHDLQVSGYSDSTVTGIWFVHTLDDEYPSIQAFLDQQFSVCNAEIDDEAYVISYYVRDVDDCYIINSE